MIIKDKQLLRQRFSIPSLHNQAVEIVRYLLYWHDSDPRYISLEAKKRVAALYLPLLNIAMDVLPLLYGFGPEKNDRYITESSGPTNIEEAVALVIAGTMSSASCDGFQTVSTLIKIKINLPKVKYYRVL